MLNKALEINGYNFGIDNTRIYRICQDTWGLL